MENETEVQRTKFITARDLGRRLGEMLDCVAQGTRLVITRWGYPVAVMEATESVALDQRVRGRAATELFEEPEDEIDLDSFEVPPEAWPILDAYDQLGNLDRVCRFTGLSIGDVAVALSKCEIAKLTRGGGGMVRLTSLGEKALKAWRERD